MRAPIRALSSMSPAGGFLYRTAHGSQFRSRENIGKLSLLTSKELRRRLARAIIIDRATTSSASFIGRVARERSEENYRFAGNFVAGKTVLDVGGGTGIGHDFLI